LSQLDSYKRGLVNSLTGNLQKFGQDRVPKVETLEELLQDDETSENLTQDCPETMNQAEEKSRMCFSTPSPSAGARPRTITVPSESRHAEENGSLPPKCL
jgi:hypothetical protein